jgi:phosphomevalonate kinase
LVLSGAYAVLAGAPAIVAAVDRYALADSALAAQIQTAEVDAALRSPELAALRAVAAIDDGALAPWFDASALRADGRKLGLGSSAAILAASLAVLSRADEGLGEALFPLALAAHRGAQGGGSGVDVAAACLGGVLRCGLTPEGELHTSAHALPDDLCIEVWSCPEAASTHDMLRAVNALSDRDGAHYRAHIDSAAEGARAAVDAHDARAWCEALGAQWQALGALGDDAGVSIVTAAMRQLDDSAREHGGRCGPSGAGGGDVALHVAAGPSEARFRARAEQAGLCLVAMRMGAPGVQRIG